MKLCGSDNWGGITIKNLSKVHLRTKLFVINILEKVQICMTLDRLCSIKGFKHSVSDARMQNRLSKLTSFDSSQATVSDIEQGQW